MSAQESLQTQLEIQHCAHLMPIMKVAHSQGFSHEWIKNNTSITPLDDRSPPWLLGVHDGITFLDVLNQRAVHDAALILWLIGSNESTVYQRHAEHYLTRIAYPDACMQLDRMSRRDGADTTNQQYRVAKDCAIETARELFANDTDRDYEKADIIRLCLQQIEHEELKKPNERVLWDWLKKSAVIPDYVSRPGRRVR